jgi:hypothetical protein
MIQCSDPTFIRSGWVFCGRCLWCTGGRKKKKRTKRSVLDKLPPKTVS